MSLKREGKETVAGQLEKLNTFLSSLSSTVSSSDLLSYLERWEKATLIELKVHISDSQLVKFRNVRLQQRFELPEETQVQQLILGFKTVLREILAS